MKFPSYLNIDTESSLRSSSSNRFICASNLNNSSHFKLYSEFDQAAFKLAIEPLFRQKHDIEVPIKVSEKTILSKGDIIHVGKEKL